MRVIYISFYSLASRKRIDAVELIARKYLLLWWSFCVLAEVGTNNIISKAQRNKAQRSFQPVKAQRNFRNELFDSVEA